MATPDQERLTRLWKVSQAGVSQALRDLSRAGYVLPLERRGQARCGTRSAGPARLVFG
jgi:DNA-binding GntR family transcriptional regulator